MSELWDQVEKAGHDFTLVSNQTGTSLYYCERCAALMFVNNQSLVEIWHGPQGGHTQRMKCEPLVESVPGTVRLRHKIRVMHDRDDERLKQI